MIGTTLNALDHLEIQLELPAFSRNVYGLSYSWLQVDENGAWDVARIITLLILSLKKALCPCQIQTW